MPRDKEKKEPVIDETQATPSTLKFIGVNGMEAAEGGSANVDLAVIDLGISMSRTFIPSDIENTLEASITQLLDAFATNRGYATTLTAQAVREYIEAAINYYALIVASWRAENTSSLRTANGKIVSSLFRTRIPMRTLLEVLTGAPIAPISDNNGGSSISNAQWLRDNVIYLQDVFLPSNVLRFIFGLFSGVYSLDKFTDAGNTSLLMLHPGLLSESDSVQVRARSAGSTLNTKASTSDMISFLKFMGWSNEEAINTDLTRDLHGNTLIIYDDPALLDQLTNAKFFYSFDLGVAYGVPGSDTDIKNLYFDPTDEYATPFVYRDRKSFDADDFMLTAMFHRGLYPDPTTPVYQLGTSLKVLVDGVVQVNDVNYSIMSPHYVALSGGSNQLANSNLNRLTYAINNWYLYFNAPLFGIPNITLSVDVSGVPTGYGPVAIGSYAYEGPNTYFINEDDMTTYRTIAWLRFIFGEDYRRWLQLSIARTITSRLGEK